MNYQAIYKCRLCGETFQDDEIYEKCVCEAKLNNAFLKERGVEQTWRPENATVSDREIRHECADGSIGISDFQGFKAVKE